MVDIVVEQNKNTDIIVEVTQNNPLQITPSDDVRMQPRISVSATEPQNPLEGDIWFKILT